MYLRPSKYSRWYDSIIKSAKSRIQSNVYTEIHHIIPKSFYKCKSKNGWLDGNPDNPDNLVRLSMREHFVCHLLLIRMVTGVAKRQMISAVWHMCNARKNHTKITSRLYDSIRTSAISNIGTIQKDLWNDVEWSDKQHQRLKSQERKEHLKVVMTKIRNTDEAKKLQSEINQQLWSDAGYREKRTKMLTEVNQRPDKRAAQSATNKALWTDEQKALWSETMRAVRQRPELRERQRQIMIEHNKNRKPITEETRSKMSASKKGKSHEPHSQSTKDKISQANSGRIFSDDHKAKLSHGSKGKVWWTNGIRNTRSIESPGPEWHRGRCGPNLNS